MNWRFGAGYVGLGDAPLTAAGAEYTGVIVSYTLPQVSRKAIGGIMYKTRAAQISVVVLSSYLSVANAAVLATAELGLDNFSGTSSQTCEGCPAQVTRSFSPPALAYFASGDVVASAGSGFLRAYANVTASGQHTGFVTIGGKASASFADFFTINNPLLDGTPGKLLIPLQFSWDFVGSSSLPAGLGITGSAIFEMLVNPNISGFSRVNFVEEFGRNGSLGRSGLEQLPGAASSTIPFTYTPTMTIDFIFGRTIAVRGKLNISAFGRDFNTNDITDMTVTLDAGHSAYWGGFASVLGADGLPVAYTTTSAEGHDWSQSSIPSPVPAPASGALLMAGVGSVVAYMRRSRQRRQVRAAGPKSMTTRSKAS